MLVFHPGATNSMLKTFEKLVVEDISHLMNIFEMTGPHSLLVAKNAFKGDLISSEQHDQDFLDLIEQAYDPIYYKPGILSSLSIKFDAGKKSQRSPFS